MEDTGEAAELPLDDAGTRLRRARETAGLSRKQLAEITKVPERHLLAIEEGNFAALPGRTYAIGFSRSYARAVGEDAAAIAALVREELAAGDPARRTAPAFEPGDPARIPSSRFAWLSALAAVVAIVAGLAFWRGYYAPGGELPSILPSETPAPLATVPPSATPVPAPVEFTAPAGFAPPVVPAPSTAPPSAVTTTRPKPRPTDRPPVHASPAATPSAGASPSQSPPPVPVATPPATAD